MEHQIDDLWRRLIDTLIAHFRVREEFFRPGVDRVALIRAGHSAGDRPWALIIARLLPEAESKQLFDIWVWEASSSACFYQEGRSAILALPRDWVLERIEAEAERHLIEGELDEWSRILELYLFLDLDLTRKLAERATAHSDADIQNVGRDFLRILGDENELQWVKRGLTDKWT